jgi:multiple sugar transport system permease protein
MSKRKSKAFVFKVLLGVGLFIFFIINIFPLLWSLIVSLKYTIDAISMPPKLIFTPTFEYYVEVFTQEIFQMSFINTMLISISSVLISIVIGAPFGYALSRYTNSGGFILLMISLVFRALPGMVFIIPYYYISINLGLYDTKILLILITVATNQPFTIWMLRSFFITIPKSLDEASMVDGCNRFQAFFKTILPIMGPGVATTAIFTFLSAYNEFMLAQALTSTSAMTLPVMVSQLTTENIRYWSTAAASSVAIALPAIVITLIMQKYLIKGMTNGAVKG